MLTNECKQVSDYIKAKINTCQNVLSDDKNTLSNVEKAQLEGQISAYEKVLSKINEVHEGLLNGAK